MLSFESVYINLLRRQVPNAQFHRQTIDYRFHFTLLPTNLVRIGGDRHTRICLFNISDVRDGCDGLRVRKVPNGTDHMMSFAVGNILAATAEKEPEFVQLFTHLSVVLYCFCSYSRIDSMSFLNPL